MGQQALHERIETIRNRLGRRLLILGHHYQKDEVIAHTDLQGDSFQLSAAASERLDCETIVFCGVHFMAETADILANSPENRRRRDGRRVDVILPDLNAGCPMADMATSEEVDRCWAELDGILDVDDIVPITYVNSTAELKAFCGRHGGIACTSSNARAVLDWAFSNKSRVLFFPDQHLGRNTALAMGIRESSIRLWDPLQPALGGNTVPMLRDSRVILWNGYCGVHGKFTPGQVEFVRRAHPGIRVIVHPECCREVVDLADEAGSTSLILQRITESAPGSKWAVGTEGTFVERLAKNNPDKWIVNLALAGTDMPESIAKDDLPFCETMGLIDLPKLARSLESIEKGAPTNIVRVDDNVAADALVCLERMLSCS